MLRNNTNTGIKKTEETLQDLFLEFGRKVSSMFKKRIGDLNLTITQVETLKFIIDKDKPTMKDIADYFDISAPSATSMVEHLISKKLVKREQDRLDRRTINILPTKNAVQIFNSLKKAKAKAISSALKNLSLKDRRNLAEIFRKIT